MATNPENNPSRDGAEPQSNRNQEPPPAWVQLACLAMLLFFIPAAFMMLRSAWKRREAATSVPVERGAVPVQHQREPKGTGRAVMNADGAIIEGHGKDATGSSHSKDEEAGEDKQLRQATDREDARSSERHLGKNVRGLRADERQKEMR